MSSTYLESLISSPRITQLTANRAGDALVSVNSLNRKGSAYRSQLHAVGEAGHDFSTFPLTAPDSNAKLLALGEDGSVFITLDQKVDGAESDSLTGVYRLPRRGEAQLEFSFPGTISKLEVRGVGEGQTLIFSAAALASTEAEAQEILDEREKTGVSAVLYEDFPTRYWDRDLGIGRETLYLKERSKDPVRIETPEGILTGFTADPTARRALVNIRKNLRGVHERTSVYLLDLFGKEATRAVATADERVSWTASSFNPSATLAMLEKVHTWLPDQALKVEAAVYNFETGETTVQCRDLDRWPAQTVWIDDANFAFVADNLGASAIFRAEVDGEVIQLTDDANHYSQLAYTSGTLLALCDNHRQAPYPVRVHEDVTAGVGTVKKIDSPIEGLQAPGRLEKLTTTAEDGTEITSWLALPEGGEGPFPLVVFAHGGPWGSWNSWTFRWNPWVLTEAGYAVLMPDPGISTGYGQAMIERGGQSVGKEPYEDIMAVVEDVVARADIDGERAAFMGGSYGGYMTNWVAGKTGERFKCFVSHASIWNQEHMYFTTDNGMWHEWMWEGEDNVRNTFSPHQFASQIKAPMLVIHGDKDYRVPISQAHMLWFDLKRNSPELEHRYLYFPDEGHWILKPGNSKIWYETVLAFLNRHVLGEESERPRLLG